MTSYNSTLYNDYKKQIVKILFAVTQTKCTKKPNQMNHVTVVIKC
jgi:hypothetical protein